jgi:hypothetical protein
METAEALTKLMTSDSLQSFMSENTEMMQIPALPQFLAELCRRREMPQTELFWEADIEKSHGYQIFKGRRRLSRDNALKIALVLKLDVTETQRLLTISMNSQLYPFIPRDAAILYCLHHGTDYMDVQERLYDLGMTVLGDDAK